MKTMNYKNAFRYMISATAVFSAVGFTAMTALAQSPVEVKKPVAEKSSGRDPFKKYIPVVKAGKAAPTKLEAPTIQVRIDRYRVQKAAAASAHIAPPKPTSVLLLSEMQVIGIFRTPRGMAAMIEATPIKLSYVIYPGESFFDGQLVAIEEGRLVFRRDIVWTDGRREKAVALTSKAAPATAPALESEKPAVPEKQ